MEEVEFKDIVNSEFKSKDVVYNKEVLLNGKRVGILTTNPNSGNWILLKDIFLGKKDPNLEKIIIEKGGIQYLEKEGLEYFDWIYPTIDAIKFELQNRSKLKELLQECAKHNCKDIKWHRTDKYNLFILDTENNKKIGQLTLSKNKKWTWETTTGNNIEYFENPYETIVEIRFELQNSVKLEKILSNIK